MGGGSWPRRGKERLTRLDIARRREEQRDWETCYRTRKRRILRSNTLDLVDEWKESLCEHAMDRDPDGITFSEQVVWGMGEGARWNTFFFCYLSVFRIQREKLGTV